MSQLIIVTTPQNSGLGTPLATAFNYTNSNFSELYARFQTSVPATLVGQDGDVPGMYAVDSTYFYYCFLPYDGSTTIWAQVTQVANISLPLIQSGTSNVAVLDPDGDVAVAINGTSNVAVFSSAGLDIQGAVTAVGNIQGSYILGNGSQLTGLPATFGNANVITLLATYGSNTISTTGNITAGYFVGNGSLLTDITGANVTGTVANAAYATTAGTANTVSDAAQPNITSVGTLTSVSVAGNTVSGNVNTGGQVTATGQISASGNIVTSGFFVGNFTGNVVATLTNIPGPSGAVVFNDGTGNAAATAGLVFDNSGPNVLTVLGSVSATADVTANVVTANIVAGTLTTAAQPNVTSVGTLTSVSVNGNVTGGNLRTAGQMSASGNVTGGNILTSGVISTAGAVTATSVSGGIVTASSVSASGAVTGASLSGTIVTASQTNITAVGTLVSLSVSGNTQSGNLRTAGQISATGNITGGNITITDVQAGGNVSASNYTGTTLSMAGNITSAANISGNYLLGNVSAATGLPNYGNSNVISLLSNFGTNVIATNGSITANSFVGDSITVSIASVFGNITVGNVLGTVASNVQTSINQVGVLSNLSVSGNIVNNGANITTGTVSASGNITSAGLSVSGNISASSLIGTIATASQPLITAVGTLTSLSVTGNTTSGNLSVSTGTITVGNIVNANANAVGNIGSATGYFNTVFAQATSAQYADLAENYVGDSDYQPGTVVIFGGSEEITVSNEFADERVGGVISANPAHLMNAASPGLAVALRGRVPVRVIGPVVKGDSLVTSTTAGAAVSVGRNREYAQAVFAKALETDLENGEKIITAVIL